MKDARDIEKVYSPSEFVAKLRRLADSIESGNKFEIQIAGERIYVSIPVAGRRRFFRLAELQIGP